MHKELLEAHGFKVIGKFKSSVSGMWKFETATEGRVYNLDGIMWMYDLATGQVKPSTEDARPHSAEIARQHSIDVFLKHNDLKCLHSLQQEIDTLEDPIPLIFGAKMAGVTMVKGTGGKYHVKGI